MSPNFVSSVHNFGRSDTMTLLREKMLIYTWCIRGFMSNLIKKSWKDSNSQAAIVCAECVNLLEKFKSSKRYIEEFFSELSCTMGSNQFRRTIRIYLFKGWCFEKVGYAGWAAAADVSRVKSVTLPLQDTSPSLYCLRNVSWKHSSAQKDNLKNAPL